MTKIGPWSEKWGDVQSLDGGGQGDTYIVKPVNGEPAQAVLKLLKANKATNSKARGRMAQEVVNLKVLHNAGGKVPKVLDDNTEKFEDLSCPLYFVMEFIEGKTLADVIQTQPMTVVQAVQVALDLCSTVRLAVNAGIAHRDIKPENIITRGLAPVDAVMVDFGLSFNQDDGARLTDADETLDNKFLSLPERRGPGENKRDFRSDLTGICCVLFYCLTQCSPRNLQDSQGRMPHRSPNYSLDSRINNPIQLAFLNALLDKGLSYEIDLRFQTVDELAKRLNEVLEPPTLAPMDDLETVAAREAAALKKNDRTTQLAEFRAASMMLLKPILDGTQSIQQRLARYQKFQVAFLGIDPQSGKREDGDLVSRASFHVLIKEHPIISQISYITVAHGMECVVYREVYQNNRDPSSAFTIVGPSTVVIRYQGDSAPPVGILLSDIEATIGNSIVAISKRIQSGT